MGGGVLLFSCFRMEIQFTLRLKSLQCLRLAVCYKYAIRTRIRIFVSRFRLPHYFRGLYKQPPLLRSKHSCSMCVCVCKCVRCLFGVFAAAKHSYNTHTHKHMQRVLLCVCVYRAQKQVSSIFRRANHIRNIYIQTYVNFPPCKCVCVCGRACVQIFVLDCVCVSFTG